jgi:branched-chain amino acid transport system ATP-binding protein
VTIELAIREVRAGYGAVEVLHGVTLDVPHGALTALLGPNGAGKTTLLSVIAGLVPIRDGDIVWNDSSVNCLAPHERAQAGMLLVPERRGVFPDLSVRDNLEVFAGSRRGWDVAFDAFPILHERLDQQAGLLSGGEQQMLAMSADLAKHGTTVVLVEQHLSDALRLADLVYVLSRGEVVFAGEPDELATGTLPGYVSLSS